ncbi:MAG TPA: hypothetical protein VM598_01380 [Bdellovibrionota bacterium]|nr:hypothetical protein [Bdellovibrionota bacterium]
MKILTLLVLLLSLSSCFGISSPPGSDPAQELARHTADWAKAFEELPRLAPESLKDVPSGLVALLKKKGCRVPKAARGVTKGHFQNGQDVDWAALCSRDKKSSVVVYFAKPAGCADELGSLDEKNEMERAAAGSYSLMIELGARNESHPYDALAVTGSRGGGMAYFCNGTSWEEWPIEGRS